MTRRLLTLLTILFLFSLPAQALEQTAEEVTASTQFSGGGFEDYAFLTDGNETEYACTDEDLTLTREGGIGGIYLVFDQPCAFTLADPETGVSAPMEGRFLHEYADVQSLLSAAPDTVTLIFPEGVSLCEVRVYSPGQAPESVQQWSAPLEGQADILLFSTHGDDEQLYFAGLLPEYAGQRELNVQVVYMTGHENNWGSERKHEMLNGLWAVGVRVYPVFGPFPDFKLPDREETYREYEELGFSRADLLRFVVDNIRRFRPQAAIGHDLDGEYGHGMHMVYADLLTQAVEISADPELFPEQVALYGTWDVPKTYLHLYSENPITLDYDRPLESFGGMTAFEVTQKRGFPAHISQQYELYTHWLYGEDGTITSPTQIDQWSPCHFGLYRSTVGADVSKDDFMENLVPYALQVTEEVIATQPPTTAPPPPPSAEAPADPIPEPSFPLASLAAMALCAAVFVLLLRRKNIF